MKNCLSCFHPVGSDAYIVQRLTKVLCPHTPIGKPEYLCENCYKKLGDKK